MDWSPLRASYRSPDMILIATMIVAMYKSPDMPLIVTIIVESLVRTEAADENLMKKM